MQSLSSRIWTHIAVFISYDDNHYTTGTSIFSYLLQLKRPALCILNPNTATLHHLTAKRRA